jgi:hypothetical protein
MHMVMRDTGRKLVVQLVPMVSGSATRNDAKTVAMVGSLGKSTIVQGKMNTVTDSPKLV